MDHFWDTWEEFLSEDFTDPLLTGDRTCAAAADLESACDECWVLMTASSRRNRIPAVQIIRGVERSPR